MATTTIDKKVPGMASSATEDWTQYGQWVSDNPTPKTERYVLAVSQTIEYLEVVKLNASGEVIAATYDAGNSYQAIGFAAFAVTTDSSNKGTIEVYIAGAPNIDSLVWDSTFDDDAKKLSAFRAAPAPSNVIPGTNAYHRKT